MIAGEDLVGTLSALHHLDVLGDLLRQQVEADASWLTIGSLIAAMQSGSSGSVRPLSTNSLW